MARTAKRLYGPAQLTNSAATVYTVPAATKTIVRNIQVQNPSGGSAHTFTLSIGSDAAGTRVRYVQSVAAGAVFDNWEYFVLEAGEVLQAYADTGAVLVMTIDGDEIAAVDSGTVVVYSKALLFNTTHVSDGTGAIVYTPTVGDILVDAVVRVTTAWNGTTPKGDLGYTDDNGLFGDGSNRVGMTQADDASEFTGAPLRNGFNSGVSDHISLLAQPTFAVPWGVFLTADPLRFWVTQNGARSGADPGASQGAATLYLMVATPIAL